MIAGGTAVGGTSEACETSATAGGGAAVSVPSAGLPAQAASAASDAPAITIRAFIGAPPASDSRAGRADALDRQGKPTLRADVRSERADAEVPVEGLDSVSHAEQAVRARRLDAALVDADAVVAHDHRQAVVLDQHLQQDRARLGVLHDVHEAFLDGAEDRDACVGRELRDFVGILLLAGDVLAAKRLVDQPAQRAD